MKFKYPIFIPTYKKDKLPTLDNLPSKLKKRVIMVVHKDDKRFNYMSHLVCPDQGKGTAKVREWIMSYCRVNNIGIACMLDDDLAFKTARWEEGKKRFKLAKAKELVEYFNKCERVAELKDSGMSSFSQEFFNRSIDEWREDKDNASTYFINVKNYPPGTFISVPTCEDRALCLKLIEKGYTLRSNTYVSSTKVGKHGRGGESAVPNRGQRQEKAIEILANRYPRFVKPRRTTNGKYIQNYGTDLQGRYYYANMRKSQKRGEDVTQ